MPKRRALKIPVSSAKVTDSPRRIYSILRKEFTAADLQKYTESEPMIPAEQVLAKMKKIHRKVTSKKRS